MAQRAACGDASAADQLEQWLSDWCSKNPPFLGPNWKCGQEASLRVMHLAMAALILGNQDRPTPGLAALLATHLMRIAPTVQYAIGQDNNHGTSEAAALFIGGSWLTLAVIRAAPIGKGLAGACWPIASALVARDGSFSQHSVGLSPLDAGHDGHGGSVEAAQCASGLSRRCHRTAWTRGKVALRHDGCAIGRGSEPRRQRWGASAEPDRCGLSRFPADAADLNGAFCGVRALPPGPWDDALSWLGLPPAANPAAPPPSAHFSDGGYAVLRGDSTLALLRYPNFRFRPSQARRAPCGSLDRWPKSAAGCRDLQLLRRRRNARALRGHRRAQHHHV